jgi:hypothetical protein
MAFVPLRLAIGAEILALQRLKQQLIQRGRIIFRPLQPLKKLAGFPLLRLFLLRGTPAGLSQIKKGDPLEAPNVAGVQSNFQST